MFSFHFSFCFPSRSPNGIASTKSIIPFSFFLKDEDFPGNLEDDVYA